MSTSFDDLMQRQVEQFNQQLADAINFHKYMLKLMCVERMMREYERRNNNDCQHEE